MPPTSSEGPSGCTELLGFAGPRLYRENLFRVLALPVRASARDAQRLEQRRSMQARLGINGTPHAGGMPPSSAPSTREESRAALERLMSPPDRFLHEVFWYWPTTPAGQPDPILGALVNGKLGESVVAWKRMAEGKKPMAEVAAHNLAVHEHMQALELEAGEKVPVKEATKAWERAFEHWSRVLEGEEFWTHLRARAEELQDVRVTTGLARRIRQTLPLALGLIPARMAVSAAERGDRSTAARLLALLEKKPVAGAPAQEALAEALAPLRDRLSAAVAAAEEVTGRTPLVADRAARTLLEEGGRILAAVDLLLPKDDLSRCSMHDSLTEAVLVAQVAFAKKTADWVTSLELLRLCRPFAAGEVVSNQVDQNIKVVTENAEGLWWYSREYWALPPEIVERLESAYSAVRLKKFDDALEILLALDATLGLPLKRCVAYTLRQKSIELFNEEIGKINPTLAKVVAASGGRRPTPETPSFMMPPCPGCGSKGYTSWTNFTFRGGSYWMCSSCSARDDGETSARKRALSEAIVAALAHIDLAIELSPKVPSLIADRESLLEPARSEGVRHKSPDGLRQRLSTPRRSAIRRVFPSQPGRPCHFCSRGEPDPKCALTVPMCGEAKEVQQVFGKGVCFAFGVITVPRCVRCRDEHRDLPARVEAWLEARFAAGSPHAPRCKREQEGVRSAEIALAQAEARSAELESKLTRATADLDTAAAVGSVCTVCKGTATMSAGVCRSCDQRLFPRASTLAVSTGTGLVSGIAAWFGVRGGDPTSLWVGAGTLAASLATLAYEGIYKTSRRTSLRAEREVEARTRRAAGVALAVGARNEVERSLHVHQESGKCLQAARDEADRLLRQACNTAIADFERRTPRPALPGGIVPESEFLGFEGVSSLSTAGWGFGDTLGPGDRPDPTPSNVGGLVSREPREPKVDTRIHIACPKCSAPHHVESSAEPTRLHCTCGTGFTYRHGTVIRSSAYEEGPAELQPEPAAKRLRDRVVAMAKGAHERGTLDCPACGAAVKAKNLVRHFDKQHADRAQEAPEATARKAAR